jgi:hypothetical protein
MGDGESLVSFLFRCELASSTSFRIVPMFEGRMYGSVTASMNMC